MDRKISRATGILSSFCRCSSISRTDLLCNDQPRSAASTVLADLCTRDSLHFRLGNLVRVKSGLAQSSTPGAGRIFTFFGISRLQPALGGVHSYQSGVDPIYFLFVIFW